MYTIKCDDKLLFDPRVEELNIMNPKLALEVNKSGAFDFKIYPNHPTYSAIQKLKSSIEVYHNSHMIFRGRVLNDEADFYNAKNIICEGDMAFFNDSIQRPYEYAGGVREYVEMIFNNHNSQVEPDKQFVLGKVTVTDPNDYITRADSTYPTTWKVIEGKLFKLLGGYFVLRRENGINYIDYLEDSEYKSSQVIEIGENLLDVSQQTKGENIATAIIPLGATLNNDDGDETEERLDITSVNDGVDYVFNQEAVDIYGWIYKTVEYDDVTIPDNLIRKGREELAKAINLERSIELSAIDKSMINVNIDDFRIFEYVEVNSKPHGLDKLFLVTKLNLDLTKPENNKLTVGAEFSTFTEQHFSALETIKNISKDYVKNETITSIRSDVRTVSSSIEQTAEELRTEMVENYSSSTDLEQFKSEISTEFTQTSTDFNYKFSNLTEWIDELDGDTKTRFNEIVKYIRFVDGKIVLGEVGNELILNISNDRISFLQSGVEVAYLSNSTLYITDAEILTSIKIGNYSFLPRTNGNLSFKWTG